MTVPIVLASGSTIRAQLMKNAGLDVIVQPARVDEVSVQQALQFEGAPPRDIADALAELKAQKVAGSHPSGLVLGCDQVLDLDGELITKSASPEEAVDLLLKMVGKRHSLYSAAVLFEDGRPIWRHVGRVDIQMRMVGAEFVQAYVQRNWDSIQHSVGCYKLEEEGVQLITAVKGDYFHVLGMPLLELLSYLFDRGALSNDL